MIEVKVTQIGNSLGIVLPKEALSHLDVEKGSKLTLTKQSHGILISSLDPEFDQAMEIAREGMRKYKNALNELAK